MPLVPPVPSPRKTDGRRFGRWILVVLVVSLMAGSRAEKGIFFTTGYFTDAAIDAARDPLSRPIELIDGDRLVELLEQYEFGLRETKTYEVDHPFISNYRGRSGAEMPAGA